MCLDCWELFCSKCLSAHILLLKKGESGHKIHVADVGVNRFIDT